MADPSQKFTLQPVQSLEHGEIGKRCRLRFMQQAPPPAVRKQDDWKHG